MTTDETTALPSWEVSINQPVDRFDRGPLHHPNKRIVYTQHAPFDIVVHVDAAEWVNEEHASSAAELLMTAAQRSRGESLTTERAELIAADIGAMVVRLVREGTIWRDVVRSVWVFAPLEDGR